MKLSLIVLLLLLTPLSLFAQQFWQRSETTDPDTGKPADQFILEGTYIEIPQSLTSADAPMIVLLCSEGRLVRQYALTRVILWNGGVRIDSVVDGGRKKSTTTSDVMAGRDQRVTGDSAHRTFSTFDLKSLLPDLLHGKLVRLAVQDDYGSGYRGSALPQVLMEFHMPDPTPILTRCGLKL